MSRPAEQWATVGGGAAALIVAMFVTIVLYGCAARPGAPVRRAGDEIVVCGQLFHTGAPVVLWTDPGGYDAYRVEKRFVPWDKAAWAAGSTEGVDGKKEALAAPNRYGLRFGEAGRGPGGTGARLSDETLERVRGGGWDLSSLRQVVDQFVIHYDACGTSRQCFRVLHDVRGLSVHFMLDIDGTIYQTLDVKERAWHAGTANDRSVGVEIANIGAYGEAEKDPFDRWYAREFLPARRGTVGNPFRTRITVPADMGDGGVRIAGFIGYAARPEMVLGRVQGRVLRQYDFTPQQYDSLVKLTATLCTVLPEIRCDYPRDGQGALVREKLPDDRLAAYKGLLGHYHIAKEKIDPGPALDWDKVILGARRRIGGRSSPRGAGRRRRLLRAGVLG